MKALPAALIICLIAGATLADVHETHTFAGPYGVLGDGNTRNTTLTATYTATDGGTPYTANGLFLQVDLTSNSDFTFANETVIRVTPPSGPTFLVYPSDEYLYDTIVDATVNVRVPAGISPAGQWSFYIYQEYEFDGAVPDAYVSNLRVSLQDLPPVELPDPVTDLGVLTGADITQTVPNYSGADVFWYKFTAPQPVNTATGFYVDIDTFGSDFAPGRSDDPNDTEIGLFDSAGILYAWNDDVYDGTDLLPQSWLSFGETAPRSHGANPVAFTGRNGSLPAGDYYLAAGPYFMHFTDGFFAGMDSLSPGGPLFQVNIYSRFSQSPAPCSAADVGVAGGGGGAAGRLGSNE
jgi:hypothetical protein